MRTDVQNPDDVKNMVASTVEKFGRLDIAVNNAGVEQNMKPLLEQSVEDFDFVTNINVRGVWLSLREEIRAMLETGGGSIVNVSSIAGVIGMANMPIYIASKTRGYWSYEINCSRICAAKYSRKCCFTGSYRNSDD